jgi:hypothetical protein
MAAGTSLAEKRALLVAPRISFTEFRLFILSPSQKHMLFFPVGDRRNGLERFLGRCVEGSTVLPLSVG